MVDGKYAMISIVIHFPAADIEQFKDQRKERQGSKEQIRQIVQEHFNHFFKRCPLVIF